MKCKISKVAGEKLVYVCNHCLGKLYFHVKTVKGSYGKTECHICGTNINLTWDLSSYLEE